MPKTAEEEAAEELAKITDQHAKDYIAKVNAQAKAEREKGEKALRELEDLKHKFDEEAKKTKDREDAEKAKAEEERKKKLSEDEKKVEAEAEKQKKADALEKRLADMEKRHTDEREADRRSLVREAVIREAEKAGLIDEDLVDLWKLDGLKIEKGKVTGVKEFVETIKAEKPHLFTKAEKQERGPDGQFRPVDPSKKELKGVDASKLDDKGFDELEAKLRGRRS